MRKPLVKKSKFLSLVLRHKPETIGLELDAEGWASVPTLLEGAAKAGVAMSPAELREIVETNDKKRFVLSEGGSRIRASQGHSITVDLGLSPALPPEHLYHGTVARYLPAILQDGLKPGSRQHVHLSADEKTARNVGSRRGKPVILTVAAAQLAASGTEFFLSANGVWLVAHVPPEFLAVPEETAVG